MHQLLFVSFNDLLFLLGTISLCSINPALLYSSYCGKDILKQGSGNPGATNAVRLFGPLVGFFIFMFDFIKPYLAYFFFAQNAQISSLILSFFPFLAICSHCFSLWHRGVGGKGVATFFGVLFTLSSYHALLTACLWFMIFSLTQVSAVASLGSIFCSMFFLPSALLTSFIPAVILITVKHWINIKQVFAMFKDYLHKSPKQP